MPVRMCVCFLQVCLQVFQLLPEQVAPLVFGGQRGESVMSAVLGFLMEIILAEVRVLIQG